MRPYYLLDTNIVSEAMHSISDEKVMEKLSQYEKLCAICATTWDELLYGIQILPEGKKKETLYSDLIDDVQGTYDVLPYDKAAATIQADIRSRLKEKGKIVEFTDTQIAAIAISNNMILVTRNTKHFKQIQEVSPLLMENWFENPASL